VLALACTHAKAAGAESMERMRVAAEGGSPAGSGREAMLEARVGDQDAALRERIAEITAVGDEVERAQARRRCQGAHRRAW
jgi:hypothetical protein